jgi:hypothetical protein
MIKLSQEQMNEAKKKAFEEKKRIFDKFNEESPDHIRNYFKMVPKTYKWLWYKCFAGVSTRPEAIKAKCIDCSGYIKEEIIECTVKTCPLWNHRPYIKK